MPEGQTAAIAEVYDRRFISAESNQRLVRKWAPVLNSGKAPALKTDLEAVQMAILLENTQATVGMDEASQNTTAIFGTAYLPAVLGMTRQVFPRLIGREIVSVQPMTQPTGKVFHLETLRLEANGSTTSDPTAYENWPAYSEWATGVAEGDNILKGMRLRITDENITIRPPYKLAVDMSVEGVQDLRAYHGLDGMDLLRQGAIDEIAREIDAILVGMVYAAAAANATVTFGQLVPASGGWTAATWAPQIGRAILLADNEVYKARGVSGTFLLAGATAALELMALNTFKSSGFFRDDRLVYGIEPVGNLDGWPVLRSRYLPTNEIVLGRKGSSIVDAGAFWLPYVPLMVSPRELNVRSLKYEQSFMSRFGTYVASNEYFVRIVLDPAAATGITVA